MGNYRFRCVPLLLAWIVMTVATGSFFIQLSPYLILKYHYSAILVQAIITFFLYSNFIIVQCMDPGTLTRADVEEFKDEDPQKAPYIKIISVDDINVRMKWCITCQFYRPPRCSHCSSCGRCIETFDHHCPWINNCIGQRNYRHFFLFLVFLCIHMMSIFCWCSAYLVDHKERLKDTNSIVALSIVVLIFFLCWPVFGLTAFHVLLITKNRTTNEQMTGKFKTGDNPFNRGCFYNCAEILCGPHMPKYSSTDNKEHQWL